MKKLITGLEAQPNYPSSDLTDSNAELLSLMLANPDIMSGGHRLAEQSIQAFRLFHPVATASANRMFDGASHLQAIDHGVACYEALCALLAAKTEPNIFAAAKVCALLERATSFSVESYVHNASDAMRQQLPRTAEVIHEASARYHGYFANLAVTGAALAWQMEVDATASIQ